MSPVSTCEYCSKQFNRRSNCLRHIKSVHLRNSSGEIISVREKFTCVSCDKQYSSKSSLDYHVRSIHLEEEKHCSYCDFKTCHKSILEKHLKKHEEKNEKPHQSFAKRYQCSECKSSFKKESSLNFHRREKHNAPKVTSSISKKCPLCPFIAVGKGNKMINFHFKNTHHINVQHEKHNFCSLQDFNTWKDEIEKKTVSFFKKKTTHSSNGLSTCTYQCHRSGIFKSVSLNKRQLKMTGSCKINGFCPAYMKTTINDKGVHVLYLSSHVGHKAEHKHIRLSKDERETRVVKKLRNLQAAHKRSLLITSENISKDGTKWQVLSSSKKKSYSIKKVMNCKSCQLQCFRCDSCFHEFECTCLDSCIKNNMCKHIHAVAKMLKENISESENLPKPLSIDTSSNEHFLDTLSNEDFLQEVIIDVAGTNCVDEDLQKRKLKLTENFEKIVITAKTKEQLEWLEKESTRLQSNIMAMDPTESSPLLLKEPTVFTKKKET